MNCLIEHKDEHACNASGCEASTCMRERKKLSGHARLHNR